MIKNTFISFYYVTTRAIASNNLQVLADKKILIDKVDELKKEYSDLEDKKIPCPEYWGGYKIKPNKIELWMDGENRLHDRVRIHQR